MKPPIFIELCAGTAALSLRLQGGPKAKPPVSRMGAKTGYADAILAVLGLYPGQGAESYLWCEPDDGVRGLLMAYPQPDVLRAAAKILRGWKDEEPRALWERLRAELKAGASVEGAEGVARWFTTAAWSFRRCEPESGYNAGVAEGMAQSATHHGGGALTVSDLAAQVADLPPFPPTFIARDGRAVTPEEVARFVQLLGSNRLIPGTIADDGRWVNAARDGGSHTDGGVSFGGEEFATSAAENAERLTQVPSLPPTFIARDGRAVTPEEVARYILVIGQTWPHKMDGRPMSQWAQKTTEDGGVCLDTLIEQAQSMPLLPPVTITDDARTLTPPKLPPGVVVFADPPYVGTTGYKHDLPRSEVVRMARLWADAGATVCISEAEAIPELMADGWHAVDISATRKGAKRTFTGQQKMAKKKQPAEWLTLSRPPSFVPRAPEVFIEAPIVEVVKPARVKAAPVEVVAAEPQEVRQVDLFGGGE